MFLQIKEQKLANFSVVNILMHQYQIQQSNYSQSTLHMAYLPDFFDFEPSPANYAANLTPLN